MCLHFRIEESLSCSQLLRPELTVYAVITHLALPGPALCSPSASHRSGTIRKLESSFMQRKKKKAVCGNTCVFDDDDDDDVINVNNRHASTAESGAGRAEGFRRRCELRRGYSTSEACLVPALDLIFSRHES